MRCFYHRETEAVAVCKACGHGVCHDCCAEVGTSAACLNRCESDVAALNELILRNRASYKKTSSLYFWFGVFFLITGLMTASGSLLTFNTPKPEYGGLVTGIMLIFFAGIFFVSSRRLRAK